MSEQNKKMTPEEVGALALRLLEINEGAVTTPFLPKIGTLVQYRKCAVGPRIDQQRPFLVMDVCNDLSEYTGNTGQKGAIGIRIIHIDTDGDAMTIWMEPWTFEPFTGPVGAVAKH